jgi:hypothetical protein
VHNNQNDNVNNTRRIVWLAAVIVVCLLQCTVGLRSYILPYMYHDDASVTFLRYLRDLVVVGGLLVLLRGLCHRQGLIGRHGPHRHTGNTASSISFPRTLS